jgi:SAM-dependent methyltransferase
VTDWFEDETFWETLERFFFSHFRSDELAEQELERIGRLIPLERGAAVLDLGCGPGRHVAPLARRGITVTGVDRTERYLARARERLAGEGLTAELVREDMRRFVRPEAFDVALNLFSTFGYFAERDDDDRVLRNVCTSLKPGGVIVMEMLGKEQIARDYQERIWYPSVDGDEFLLEEHAVLDGFRGIENTWTVIRDGARRTFSVTVRIYSGVELEDALHRAGFAQVRLYGSLDGTPYDHEAERLVAIAEKERA